MCNPDLHQYVNLLTADQYLAIILPGRMYKNHIRGQKVKAEKTCQMSGRQRYADFAADSLERMRYDDDRLLRVKTIEYAPYAVLNYVNPIVSIIYGFTGFTMEKR